MLSNFQKSRSAFIRTLLDDIEAMEYMLDHDWFESDKIRIGAEQEIVIIDQDNYRPRMLGPRILSEYDRPWLVSELAQFNLEINLSPQEFHSDCFTAMHHELTKCLHDVRKMLHNHGADYLLTGILPTLHKYHLDLRYLTPKQRYSELMDAIKSQLRSNSFELRLRGIDELLVNHDSPLLEACNTSFQVHLQVSPHEFVDYYNCALALTAPSLAIASNSPIVFGHRLWHETRIALFQQAIDTRGSLDHMRQMSPRVTLGNQWIDRSVIEIFQDDIARFRVLLHEELDSESTRLMANGTTPKLKALQLHNGTIYRWNRPCYGISDNGKPHLRIENRILPAGPTVLDEMANCAFWLGAMIGMKHQHGDPRHQMSYDDVRDNFGKAARFGIDSKFTWFKDRKINTVDLIYQILLPLAEEGLNIMNVDSSDIDKYLTVIKERTQSHMTGARWMLRSYSKLMSMTSTKDQAQTLLTGLIHQHQNADELPVHRWPEPSAQDLRDFDPRDLNVSDFMETELYTVQDSDLLLMVRKLMEWKEIPYCAVEDSKGNLQGLISKKTIDKYSITNPHVTGTGDILIKDVMDVQPHTIGPDTSILEAKKLMEHHQIECLPVVRRNELLGMLYRHTMKF